MTTLVQEANRDESEVPEGHKVLAILDKTGDTRIIWDPASDAEVENARRTFNEMLKQGYTAWSVTRKGDKDKRVKEFDPEAEKLILAPAMVGG